MKRLSSIALAAALGAGPLAAPALADGGPSTRNIFLGTAAAIGGVLTLGNLNRKRKQKQLEEQEISRRQDSYRAYFYRKYGYYPTTDQVREWYQRTYGVAPAT